jgi:hypothetical protein
MRRLISSYAVDYHPKTIERENEGRYPPRNHHPRAPTGHDFESLTAKHGRPVGPFEKGRQHPYRAALTAGPDEDQSR